jgi:signal transduction histidine kinase
MLHNIRWSSLSLTTRVLILLSIPLSLQLGFGIVTFQLQQEAEAAARRADYALTIETQLKSLVTDGVQLLVQSQLTLQSQWHTRGINSRMPPQITALLHGVREKYTNLDNLTKDTPNWHRVVKQSFSPLMEVVQILDQVNDDILAGNIKRVVANSAETSEHLQLLGDQFIYKAPLVLAQDREALANTQKQATRRQTAVKCAFTLILANIIFSLILSIFLVKSIISRLRTMADNAVRLATHQPLNPPLKGDDEIAKLDHTFHRMAHTIEASARAKQDLYNTLTNDLRAPLIAIQGCLGKLDHGQTEEFNEHAKKLIRVAVRSSARTLVLVNDLLDSQKLEAGTLGLDATNVHLADVFDDINQDLSGWIEENGLQFKFASTDLLVAANQDMLCRILFNLISNAIKYSPRGGIIAINVTAVSSMAEITVSDQGPGIPKHMQNVVFDRFRQVSSSDPVARVGSGLGLSICHDFVHLHGGEIWVTSEVDHGSTFHFTLPLA